MAETVADIMSRTVISAAPDTSIKEVIHLLADQHIGGLPVIDGKGKIGGGNFRDGFTVAGKRSNATPLYHVAR
jgi:CBS domain-containing protein